MYPVYIYEENMTLPSKGTYYVIAGNGTWLHKDTGIVSCFIPVQSVSYLPDFNAATNLICSLPPIPSQLVSQVKEFFRRVVEVHRAESEINLYYSKELEDYKIVVPEQRVTHGSVHYALEALSHIDGMDIYLRVGTIHSHCDFGAFHSGTDVNDEKDFDGLHVTFGNNDKEEFTISASIVANNNRMTIDPQIVMDGIELVKDDVYRLTSDTKEYGNMDEWMAKVSSGYSQVVLKQEYSQLRSLIGEGPFEVIAQDERKMIVETKFGDGRFPKRLFEEVQ